VCLYVALIFVALCLNAMLICLFYLLQRFKSDFDLQRFKTDFDVSWTIHEYIFAVLMLQCLIVSFSGP